jgi:hypothetical protein
LHILGLMSNLSIEQDAKAYPVTEPSYSMSKDTINTPREERLQVMLTPVEVKALDDFRFRTRMPSRAAAIRELLKRGLSAEGFDLAQQGGQSSDYGVIGSSPGGTKNRADR